MKFRKLFRKKKPVNSRKPVNNNKKAKTSRSFWSGITSQKVGYTLAVLLLIFTVYLTIAFISFIFTGDSDQSKLDIHWGKLVTNPEIRVENAAGKTGAWLADVIINRWFGIASFVFIYLLLIVVLRLTGLRISHFRKNVALSLIAVLWISVTLGFLFQDNASGAFLYPGGKYGFVISSWISSMIGKPGSALLLLAAGFLICAVSFRNFLPWMMRITLSKIKSAREETPVRESEEFLSVGNPDDEMDTAISKVIGDDDLVTAIFDPDSTPVPADQIGMEIEKPGTNGHMGSFIPEGNEEEELAGLQNGEEERFPAGIMENYDPTL